MPCRCARDVGAPGTVPYHLVICAVYRGTKMGRGYLALEDNEDGAPRQIMRLKGNKCGGGGGRDGGWC